MHLECSCGDGCSLCEGCGSPICECYCDYDSKAEASELEDDEESTDW